MFERLGNNERQPNGKKKGNENKKVKKSALADV